MSDYTLKVDFPVKFYPKQLMVLRTVDDQSISEVLVDGSKGSGKSLIASVLGYYAGMRYKRLHIGMFRRTLPELRETLLRYALEIYPAGTYKQKVAERKIVLSSNSHISMNYIEKDDDLKTYQGQNYQLEIYDESTNFTEYQLCFMRTQLRSVTAFNPKMYYFTNPLGISHNFHKERFVDGKEPFVKYETPESIAYREIHPGAGAKYLIRIPIMTEDNIVLMKNNPQYIASLNALPDRERKALRDGSWDIQAGLFFSQWDKNKHIIPGYTPQHKDNLFMSCDWGTNKPFAIGWYAVTPEDHVILYREYYGIKGSLSDEGCDLTATQVAAKIIEYTPMAESIKYMVLDTACWSQQGHGISIYELMQDILKARGIWLIKANKDRVNGWEVVKKYLLDDTTTGMPFFQVTKSCKHFLRTFPYQMYSGTIEGDLDSRAEDHFCDSLRYMLCSRPLPRRIIESTKAPYFSLNWFKNLKNIKK